MLKIRNLLAYKNKINLFKSEKSSLFAEKAKEDKVKVLNWELNYLTVGHGPHKVLCMPGALGTIWTDFRPQIEGFDKEKFTLVVWDPPGYGKSRPPEKDFSIDFYETDAKYAFYFMKALLIDKYSVLGWSDGGTTAMMLAAKHPQVVNKLVIWGTNAFIVPKEVEIYQKLKDIRRWSKRARDPLADIYGEELLASYWASWVEGVINIYKKRHGNIALDYLKYIRCPTLILYGEQDPIVDPIHATFLHRTIDKSRLILYPDGKHNIHLVFPYDFNARVQNFLVTFSRSGVSSGSEAGAIFPTEW